MEAGCTKPHQFVILPPFPSMHVYSKHFMNSYLVAGCPD